MISGPAGSGHASRAVPGDAGHRKRTSTKTKASETFVSFRVIRMKSNSNRDAIGNPVLTQNARGKITRSASPLTELHLLTVMSVSSSVGAALSEAVNTCVFDAQDS